MAIKASAMINKNGVIGDMDIKREFQIPEIGGDGSDPSFITLQHLSTRKSVEYFGKLKDVQSEVSATKKMKDLYSHVVKGWKNILIYDAAGKLIPVEFSTEAIPEVMAALQSVPVTVNEQGQNVAFITWIISTAMKVENFVDTPKN